MGKETNYNKFCFLNEIPSFYLSRGVLERTAEHSKKILELGSVITSLLCLQTKQLAK